MAKQTNGNAAKNDAAPTEVKNETAATAAAPAKPAEPTSEKLESLKKAKTAAMSEAAKLQMAGDEVAAEQKFMEVYKIGEDIKKEIAAIKQHEAELLRKEKEAATVKLFDDAIEAYDNHLKVAASKASIDEKNEAYHSYQAKREVVVNRLLGSRPASAKGTSTASTGTKGATGSAIRDLITSKLAEGKSITEAKKEIKELGYARGTVDTAATDMKKEGLIDY